jgi:2-amino-4-hydroxy-6-hydroxymethyldihydropteridine diphosphokinase
MSAPTRRAGIGLGGNIPPRCEHLRRAVAALRLLHLGPPESFLVSGVFETEPVGCAPDTAPFLNAAAELSTPLDPEPLLERLRQIEIQGGRPASHGTNAPRTIDLDLLYLGSETRNTPSLLLPHPRLASRPFVLAPLAQIAPGFVPPGLRLPIARLARECGLAGIRPRGDCLLA